MKKVFLAKVMRTHTLERTGGKTYSEMGRFLTAGGKDTNDETAAAKDEAGKPVENGLRNLWVTETALTTALNTAYFAEQVALFSIAMLLAGTGFGVLTFRALKPVEAGDGNPVKADKTAVASA